MQCINSDNERGRSGGDIKSIKLLVLAPHLHNLDVYPISEVCIRPEPVPEAYKHRISLFAS